MPATNASAIGVGVNMCAQVTAVLLELSDDGKSATMARERPRLAGSVHKHASARGLPHWLLTRCRSCSGGALVDLRAEKQLSGKPHPPAIGLLVSSSGRHVHRSQCSRAGADVALLRGVWRGLQPDH